MLPKGKETTIVSQISNSHSHLHYIFIFIDQTLKKRSPWNRNDWMTKNTFTLDFLLFWLEKWSKSHLHYIFWSNLENSYDLKPFFPLNATQRKGGREGVTPVWNLRTKKTKRKTMVNQSWNQEHRTELKRDIHETKDKGTTTNLGLTLEDTEMQKKVVFDPNWVERLKFEKV